MNIKELKQSVREEFVREFTVKNELHRNMKDITPDLIEEEAGKFADSVIDQTVAVCEKELDIEGLMRKELELAKLGRCTFANQALNVLKEKFASLKNDI